MSLETYKHKRNFSDTPEPVGTARAHRSSGHAFVIQKHDARKLHYDLRLELGGVMKSWAVPKGPSLNPSEKHLAIQVEDHPIEYNSFEGVIPEGNYGAGTVIIWDRGVWKPENDPEKGLEQGKLSFTLKGEKLKGAWSLVKMKDGFRNGDSKKQWLLIKQNDNFANEDAEITEREPRSVVSNKTIDQISTDSPGGPREKSKAERESNSELNGEIPRSLSPQLATLVSEPPKGSDWIHERKFDGYRLLAYFSRASVQLLTRNSNDWTNKLPELKAELEKLGLHDCIVDGELVALTEKGETDFQLLQNSFDGDSVERIYFAFDLLYHNGRDLRNKPLKQRRERLEEIIKDANTESLRFSEALRGDAQMIFKKACELRLEGIVSKRLDSKYVSRRSRSWLKTKCVKQQEFIIGGYTPPSGSRSGFGALLLGIYDNNVIRYCGKVGTGFSEKTLSELSETLAELAQVDCPFSQDGEPELPNDAFWVKPALLCEVRFHEWTSSGALRHPVFQGVRRDKPAQFVTKEEPESLPDKKERNSVRISNPNKILFPEAELSKSDLLDYYSDVAEPILAQISKRPLMLLRCPDGRHKECFFQKHFSKGLPQELSVVEIDGESYISLSDRKGLFALVQLGTLEIHVWNASAPDIEHPDQLVFDLDPDSSVEWKDVIELAEKLREVLQTFELTPFVRTSGGKGLHLVVPLEPGASWDTAKEFSKQVASFVSRMQPALYTATSSKSKRQGKIYIDYLRNSRGASAIASYSLRARPEAPVATPLRWEELSRVESAANYTIKNIRRRLGQLSKDPWENFESARTPLGEGFIKHLKNN